MLQSASMSRRRIQLLAQRAHLIHRLIEDLKRFIDCSRRLRNIHPCQLQTETCGSEQRPDIVMHRLAGLRKLGTGLGAKSSQLVRFVPFNGQR
jgi:hypothetical protein